MLNEKKALLRHRHIDQLLRIKAAAGKFGFFPYPLAFFVFLPAQRLVVAVAGQNPVFELHILPIVVLMIRAHFPDVGRRGNVPDFTVAAGKQPVAVRMAELDQGFNLDFVVVQGIRPVPAAQADFRFRGIVIVHDDRVGFAHRIQPVANVQSAGRCRKRIVVRPPAAVNCLICHE